MKKRILWIGLAILSIALAGIFVFQRKQELIIHPERGPITEAVYGLGKVEAHKHHEVIIGVLSSIQKIYVKEGQDVENGAPLIMLQDGIVFKTPIAGTVTLVKFKEGESALPQVPIVRVEDLHDCYIELSLEQEAALRVRKGMNARVSFESIRNKVLPGKVTALFSREEEFLAHITVGDLDPGVLPGMTADVVIEVGANREALLVPARAVTNGRITVRRKEKWVNEEVEIGNVDGTHVEILSPKLTTEDELRMKKGP